MRSDISLTKRLPKTEADSEFNEKRVMSPSLGSSLIVIIIGVFVVVVENASLVGMVVDDFIAPLEQLI